MLQAHSCLLPSVGHRAKLGHQRSNRPAACRQGIVRAWAPATPRALSTRSISCRATKEAEGEVARLNPKSAREAIETATRIQNEQKDYAEAVRLYVLAMDMKPNEDEARAAMYNMGCALAKQKQWARATDCIMQAVNKYSLKLAVALKDDDLAELRDRREWLDALMQMKGGMSRNTKIDMRTEAKAPFRFPRIILFSGLGIGAAAGLVIIIFRTIAAIKGGPDAPDLQESLQNLAINTAAVAILGFLVYRDLQTRNKSVKVTEREEALGRLQVQLSTTRQLPLLRLRGQVRPVILCGTRAYVETAIREADPYYQKLRDRGVSVLPVILDEVEAAKRAQKLAASDDPDAKIRALKKEFQQQRDAATKGFGGKSEGGQQAAQEEVEALDAQTAFKESDKKWRLMPYQVVEWKEWVDNQRDFAALAADARDIFIQIQLDGTVRTSGRGIPNWAKLVDDLPPLDSVRTTLMDGIGSTEV